MRGRPWWIDRAHALLAPADLTPLDVGALWNLSERIHFVRENVEPTLLQTDFLALPHSRETWSSLVAREPQVLDALEHAVSVVAASIRSGQLRPSLFRRHWEGLGLLPHAEGAGTPADDFLDGIFHILRLTTGEAAPSFGMPNMSSRAHRIADFLGATGPASRDVVFDLGSGSGKVALTVATSTEATVRGIECGARYVAAARQSATLLGLRNADFTHADVRDVDLSSGTLFYLYYPFHGEVARCVAETLGRLASNKEITVYSSGPMNDFGEHLMAQVKRGRLHLCERRGEFSEVLVLRSPRPTQPRSPGASRPVRATYSE